MILLNDAVTPTSSSPSRQRCLVELLRVPVSKSLGVGPHPAILGWSSTRSPPQELCPVQKPGFSEIVQSGKLMWRTTSQNSVVISYPQEIASQASSTYSITVNGKSVFVEKYNSISYAHFSFAGKADVEITVKENVKNYTLSPKGYSIPSIKNRNKISFSLTEPKKLILHQVNSLDEKLFILADPLEDKSLQPGNPNLVNIMKYDVDNTGINDSTAKIQQAINKVAEKHGILYFPPGVYKTQQLNLKSNMTVYLAGGAVLEATKEVNPSFGKGLLNLQNVSNVKIMGRGVLNGHGSYWRPRSGWYDMIRMSNVKNVVLQDIIIRDTCVANVWIEYSENISIYNTKILSDPHPYFLNTDGLDFWSSKNITVDNILYKGTDDAISQGGDSKFWIKDNENIDIRNSVFYTGGSFKIGTSTNQHFIRNITYENIDVVYTEELAGFFPVTAANFENIYIKNIRVEDILDAPRNWGSGLLFNWRIMVADWEPTSSSTKLGYIKNVYVENLKVDAPKVNNSIFQGYDAQRNISNVTFNNFTIRGHLVTKPEDALFKISESEKDGKNYVQLNFTQSNPMIVNITATKMYADASGNAGEFMVTRTGDTSQPLTVKYTIRGTAENGVDYQSIADSVTIPLGASQVAIPIHPQKHHRSEGLHTVFLSLENLPNSTQYMLGSNFHAVVSIMEKT